MIVERIVFETLRLGLERLRLDPRLLTSYYVLQGLRSSEADYLRDVFLDRGLELTHASPTPAQKFPLAVVLLGKENRAVVALDDYLGYLQEGDAVKLGVADLAGKPLRGGVDDQVVHVVVCTDNKDVTIGYYYLVKYVLTILMVETLKEEGLLELTWSGQDVRMEATYFPGPMWCRKLTLNCKSEDFGISRASEPIRTLTGVYVDDGINTTADTLLTVYVPFET